MDRRRLFLSTAKAALASVFGGSYLGLKSAPAEAQIATAQSVSTGPPDVSVLPYPDPEFKGFYWTNYRGLEA